MYMQPVKRAKSTPAPSPAATTAIGIGVLSISALLLLPSIALYAVYIAAAVVARPFLKNARASR